MLYESSRATLSYSVAVVNYNWSQLQDSKSFIPYDNHTAENKVCQIYNPNPGRTR